MGDLAMIYSRYNLRVGRIVSQFCSSLARCVSLTTQFQ